MLAGGSSSIGIGLAVRLRDQFTANANRVAASMNRMHENAEQVVRANSRMLQQVGVGMMVASGIALRGWGRVIRSGADFEWTMKGVQAVTQATNQELYRLSEISKELGKTAIFSPSEVASAQEYLARAGFSVSDITKTIEAVVQLGAAVDERIGGKGGAADMMTNMMTAFDMTAESSTRMADILTKATTSANVDIQDLHESMKFMGQSIKETGYDFEDAAAMVATLGNAGVRAGIAGRALDASLRYINRAVGAFRTGRQEQAFNMLGFDPQNLLRADGEMRNMVEILDMFKVAFRDMPSPQKLSVIQALMDIRGGRAFISLLQDRNLGLNFEKMRELLLTESGGEALRIATERMNSLSGVLKQTTDTWEALKIEITEALKPILMTIIPLFKDLLDMIIRFVKTPIGKFFTGLALAATVAIGALGTFLAITGSIGLLMIGTKVSMKSLGETMVWSWNAASAAALRYLGITQAVNVQQKRQAIWDAATGRWRGAGGRFVKGPGQAGGALAGTTSILSKFLNGIRKIADIFFKVIKGAGGLITVIVSVMGALFGFKNLVKGVILALGSLLNAIYFPVDLVKNLISNPMSPLDAWDMTVKSNRDRQNWLRESLGFEPMPIDRGTTNSKFRRTQGFDTWDDLMRQTDSLPKGRSEAEIKNEIILDREKVGESLSRLLFPDTNN